MRNRGGVVLLVLALVAMAPAAVSAEDKDKDASKFDMSKGGPTWSYGNNSLTFGMFTQARFLAADQEAFDLDAAGTDGAGVEDGLSTGFKLARIRLNLRGTLFQPWVKYVISYELSDTSGDKDAKFKDAFIEFAKAPMAAPRIGQYKVPFSLQELAGDQNQLFVERAITNTFAPGREAGAGISGISKAKHFGYAAGVFNGSGESKSQDEQGLMYVARVWWQPLAEYRINETAQDAPEHHAVHFGAAYRTGEAGRGVSTGGAWQDPNNQTAWNLEAAWKWRRWYATGEYFSQTTEAKNPPPVGPDVDADGFHVQGSFMALPKKLEFGARYAVVDSNTSLPDAQTTEIRGVVNYYWWGDNLKVGFDFGTLKYDANAAGRTVSVISQSAGVRLDPGAVTDKVARLQVQFGF